MDRMIAGLQLCDRIKLARNNARLTQEELAEVVGVSPAAVAQWETGQTQPRPTRLRKLATLLNVSYSWLATGEETYSPRPLTVRGEVAAGVWREVMDLEFDPIPVAPHPDYPAHAQYGLLVRGNSVNRIARDGEYVHVVDVQEAGLRVRIGDLVVVERRRHDTVETTAKRLARDDGKRVLLPESDDPRFQEAIPYDDQPGDDVEVTIRAVIIGRYVPIPRGEGY